MKRLYDTVTPTSCWTNHKELLLLHGGVCRSVADQERIYGCNWEHVPDSVEKMKEMLENINKVLDEIDPCDALVYSSRHITNIYIPKDLRDFYAAKCIDIEEKQKGSNSDD